MTFPQTTAVWAITPDGLNLARTLTAALPGCTLFASEALGKEAAGQGRFARLKPAVAEHFGQFQAHVFITAVGIAVRLIAPLIVNKTVDPAVVAVDDRGRHAVSLLSGHLGGANALCRRVAELLGSRPVITTATDLHRVTSVDLLALERDLAIENPDAIRHVSMALLSGKPAALHDPYGLLAGAFAKGETVAAAPTGKESDRPAIVVDDRVAAAGRRTLLLRPRSLVAGIGCNRNTPKKVLKNALFDALDRFRLAPASLAALASIDVKSDEPGLLALASELNLPLRFFSGEQLKAAGAVPNPSAVVRQHVGVESVCEAAAILGARLGRLIVPKQRTTDTTVAVARIGSMSSASGPEM